MNQPPHSIGRPPGSGQEAFVRRLILFNSLMLAGWLIVIFTLAVVAILLQGKINQASTRIEALSKQVADLSDKLAQHNAPAAPRPPDAGPPIAAAAGTVGTRIAAQTLKTEPAEVAPTSTTGSATTQPVKVTPVAAVPTADAHPPAPAGPEGLFRDLQAAASVDPENPMVLKVLAPATVHDALAQIAKLDPAQVARQGVTAADRVRAAQLFLQAADAPEAHRWASSAAKESPSAPPTAADPAAAALAGRAWLAAGLASLAQRDYPSAIQELTAAADRLPGRPEPLKGLGEAYAAANQLDQAVAAYRKAVAAVPKDLAVASRLADLLTAAHQMDAAAALLRSIIAEDPKRSADRARLARLLVVQDKPKDALAVIADTPAGLPDDVRLLLAKGQALLATNDLPAAEAAFDQAVAVSPLSSEGWHFLGLARLKQRKNGLAAAALERSIAIDSTTASSWEYLGVALANDGKLDDAIGRLQEAIRLNISSAQMQYILALLYVWKKTPDAALAPLKRAVEIDASYLEKARHEPVFINLPADSVVAKFLAAGR